ncbi:hypothetical protein BDA99DRAFT_443164 [Phascolomyces articulosus]|uniref:Vacuolar protein sorting-associated protein n=1 Tax=Phascolomyces articulosus TaxID=60185 RepID=A0AAD5PAZ9_9FUNG|nr:hypothetical protein BDA99DRAFT_443164 [Phascolomyces articulosus]
MLESLVSTLLNRVLGQYVSNLNYNQLQIGIWSGHLGELTLNIPWSNLKGKPVMVYIKDVYVLAGPRNESNMTVDELNERQYQQKMRKLANSELAKPITDAKNETFAEQLMTRVLNNLQFSVTNIHVRYEDNVSAPQRFAAGITLSELSAISTDENWMPQTISDVINTIHKLATLESLSIYWNTDTRSLASLDEEESHRIFKELIATKTHIPSEHQYILKPVSGTGRIKMNKKFGDDIPKVDATLLFDELSFVIDDEQYRDTILMVDLFHSYLKKQKYLHLHPGPGITPKTKPKEYFQFAANAVLSEIHDRNYRWTWDHFKKRRDERLAYIDCYVDNQLKRASQEQLDTLDELEHKLSYEDIRFYRSRAKSRLKREMAILAEEERRRKEAANAQQAASGGWLSSWWYGTDPSAEGGQETNQDLVITEEQKQEFYDAIEYDEDKAAAAAAVAFAKDTMKLSLKTTLNKGSFTIKRNPHSEKPTEVVSLIFDTVILGAIRYVESFKASAALGDLRLYDGVTKNTQYRQLIGAKEKAEPGNDTEGGDEDVYKIKKRQSLRRRSNVDPQLLKYSTIQDPFFSIVFEHKPLDGRADNGVALVMRNIDIVYNPLIIREVISFFTPPETSADSINALIEIAGDTFEDIKNQTRVNLEYALEQHTTFDLKVDMDAPVIVIPEDCTVVKSRGIVIDAGHINVESDLAPPEIVQQIKSKRATDYTSDDYVRLRSLMYDKFAVHLTQTKILIGESVDVCMDQVRNPKKENNYLHLVDRIDMSFLVEMCIIRNSTDLTNLKVSGHLPLLAVNFSDTKYRILMEIPRLIEASGILNRGSDSEQQNAVDDADDGNNNNRLMHTRLWEQTDKEIVLDSESEEDSTLVSHSTSASGKRGNVQQRIFELNFQVDRASANIFQAASHGREVLLCDLVLQHLSVDYRLRPFDTRIEVSLKSLDVTDRMKHGNEFKYLITSDQEVLHNSNSSEEDAKELVHVDYIRVDRSSPEYLDKYNGMDQTATVALSTLNFIVTRSSVLTLYNFVLNTFVDQEPKQDAVAAVQKLPDQKNQQQQQEQQSNDDNQQQSMRVTLLLDSVNFILNNDGVRLATAELSHGDMTTIMSRGTTKVAAKFANFTLTDDLSPVSTIGQPKSYDSRQLLTIQGEELIDLRFETFIDDEYDQSLYIKMGSAQFTFLERPVQQLLIFLSKFAAMKSVYDRARQAALESAQQFQQSVAKTHFDIVIQTPVILFPEMHEHPLDVVVAHLGEIKTSNTFVTEKDMCMNVIKADVRAINLTSKYYHPGRSPGQIQLQTLPIIDDIDLSFDIKSIHETLTAKAEPRPDIDISSSVTDIRMHLTDRQYTFLMDAANMFSRVFGGGPAADEDTEKPSPPPLPRRKGSSPQSRKSISLSPPSNTAVAATTATKNKIQEAEGPQQPRLKMSLDSKTIGLYLYIPNPTNTDDPLELVGLSGIALNDTALQIMMKKDDTISVALKIVSMTIDDTRPNIKSKFTHIMPVTENGHQFEMQLDISAPNPGRHGIAMITVADPKVVLSLDHTFLLYNFFMRPFDVNRRQNGQIPQEVPLPQKKQQSSTPTTDQDQDEGEGMEIYYRIHINNPEFILLANPDATDSEAVVLSAQQVMFSKQSVMALVVKQVGMFLCRMDMRQTSTLRFIQTFDVSLSMNNNSGQKGPMTELEIDVEALVLRLSSRDAMLITDIFNKAYELYSTSASIVDKQMQQIVSSVGQSLMHESLRASFQGLQVILIEEIHEMPMIDINIKPFSVDVANWSRSLSVNVAFSMFMNYFNIKNSHWEPLLEPWSFELKLDRKTSQDPMFIKLISNRSMNLNITHTFLESAMAILHLWDKQKELAYNGERGTVAPYRLRNCTGYRLHVWNRDSPEKMVVKTLEDGADMPWWFEDWRERRETTRSTNNMLSVQLDGALWETLRNIPVDIQGEHTYSLRPRINDIQHRVVFDVKLVNNLKVVTIRSTMVIENRTLLPVEVGLLDTHGQQLDGPVKKIAPGEDYALPIEKAYSNRFCIRPDAGFGYTWIDHALHWKNFANAANPAPKTIQCKARDGDMPPFIFQIHARLVKKDVYYGQYPNMKIRLSAPIEVENLLPYDFNFRIIDKTSGQDFSSFLRKGGTTPLHVIENGHLLLMNIQMPDSDYSSSEFAIISTRGTEDLNIDDTLQLTSKDNVRLTLRINTIDIPDSGGARKYVIYSPYVMINKSGCAISFRPKVAWQSSMFSGSQGVSVWRMHNKPEPFMFSYPKLENSNRSLIQVSGSDWSEPLSLEAVGSVQDVALPKMNGTEEVHLGISVQEGQGKYKLTKVITFTPRFILNNQMGDDVRYREPESRVDHELGSDQRIPLYNLRNNAEKQLSIKLPGITNTWSAPFNIQDIGTVHVRLESADGSTSVLMRVTTILENATVFIVLNREAPEAWPYRIVNQTDEDMTFYQEDPIVILRDDYTDNQMRNHRTRRYRLPAHQTVPYSWDMPAVKDKKLILNIGGRERSINMQEIGSQLPFRHAGRNGRQAITAIDIKTRQSTQILYLTPYIQSESYFRPLTSEVSLLSASSQETVAREGFETVDVKPVIHFVIELKMSQIGISFVNRQLQEIAYITFRGLELKFTESNMYQSVRWIIKWVQIDNQLYDAVYPILLYPTNVTAESKNEILPTFQLGLDRVKDDSHGVLYFKYFSILLQEISIELDSEFIFAIIDFVDLGIEGRNDGTDDVKQWEFSTDIPDVTPQNSIAQLYFEMLNIQPITFDLSFMRTDKYDDQTRSQFFLVDVLTMAIGSIQAAPLRFNALAVENLRASGPDLANRIYIHYSNQFVNQLHMMLGSADILGNPVGLFNNLSSGVAELYYESWQGFIYSDRPQDLGIGIARGFSGFLRKSVFGVTDSFSKFTASMGKGLSAVAMDREYLDRRRMNMTRNRPRHAFGGVVQGANYFANGLISGATGLVTQPIAGARKGGVGGFATGMYKGLLGAVAKPVGGVFDMASNVGQGIRNSTTSSDTNDIGRIRYPRYIGPDGILKPYSIREAQGQVWLKDVEHGQYFNDIYIAHCPVQSGDERVAMLTSNRLMLIRTSRLAVEWQEPFTEIQTIKAESTGIAIYLRSMSWEPFLVIPDKTVREWFFKRIEEAVIKYNAKRRPSV